MSVDAYLLLTKLKNMGVRFKMERGKFLYADGGKLTDAQRRHIERHRVELGQALSDLRGPMETIADHMPAIVRETCWGRYRCCKTYDFGDVRTSADLAAKMRREPGIHCGDCDLFFVRQHQREAEIKAAEKFQRDVRRALANRAAFDHYDAAGDDESDSE